MKVIIISVNASSTLHYKKIPNNILKAAGKKREAKENGPWLLSKLPLNFHQVSPPSFWVHLVVFGIHLKDSLGARERSFARNEAGGGEQELVVFSWKKTSNSIVLTPGSSGVFKDSQHQPLSLFLSLL